MVYYSIRSGCYGLLISRSSNQIDLARKYACSVLQDCLGGPAGYMRLVAFLVKCDKARVCLFIRYNSKRSCFRLRSSELRLESWVI